MYLFTKVQTISKSPTITLIYPTTPFIRTKTDPSKLNETHVHLILFPGIFTTENIFPPPITSHNPFPDYTMTNSHIKKNYLKSQSRVYILKQ